MKKIKRDFSYFSKGSRKLSNMRKTTYGWTNNAQNLPKRKLVPPQSTWQKHKKGTRAEIEPNCSFVSMHFFHITRVMTLASPMLL